MNRILSFLAIALITLSISTKTDACTNILITKGATVDGSTMISYAADSHVLYGELYHWPARQYPAGSILKVVEWDTGKSLGEIEQVEYTYSVIGNMNEHQLSIGETTYGGRSELRDTTGLIDYGSLIYITLQRAKTAREAIETMAALVEKYGYYSSGETFSIADPNEVWIMDLIGKGVGNKGAVWVAVKIPDGYISAHANQARITTFPLDDKENCLYSEDVISFAKEKGYFKGKKKDFSFSDTYAPLDFGAVRFCEARVWSAFRHANTSMDKYVEYAMGESSERMPLFIKPDHKLSRQDVMAMMRDHFEGTPMDMSVDVGAGSYKLPYRWRPLTWVVDSVEYFNERAIATQQTGFSFVAQMRSQYPDPIGGILWFGIDDAASSVYMPMYCGITKVPHCIEVGNGDMLTYSSTSAFWVFNTVSNRAYSRYKDMIVDIKKVQSELENKFFDFIPAVDEAAKALYEKDPELACSYLTDFSVSQAEMTVDRWRDLGNFLLVKYLDGNLHPEENGEFKRNPYGHPAHPEFHGYSKEFYEKIVDETGDKLKMKELPVKK